MLKFGCNGIAVSIVEILVCERFRGSYVTRISVTMDMSHSGGGTEKAGSENVVHQYFWQ